MKPMNTRGTDVRRDATGGCGATRDALRALDFAIWETALYLDAYPDNQRALDYYHRLCTEREQLMAAYEKNCGPLSLFGNVSRNSWDWVGGPWPWEPDAN